MLFYAAYTCASERTTHLINTWTARSTTHQARAQHIQKSVDTLANRLSAAQSSYASYCCSKYRDPEMSGIRHWYERTKKRHNACAHKKRSAEQTVKTLQNGLAQLRTRS